MKKRTCFSLIIVSFFFLGLRAQEEDTILIKNGTIVPIPGQLIKNGSVLIQNGKIVKIGTAVKVPSGAKIIDAEEMFVYPGLVAPMTAIGVTGYPGAGNDTDEIGVSNAHMDPYDAINPEDESIDVTRIEGVTTVLTASGTSSVINGKSLILNLEGNLADDMVMKKYAAQIFNVGAKQTDKYPTTLPGIMAMIRDKLNHAKEYAEKIKEFQNAGNSENSKSKATPPSRDLEMEALLPVIAGKIPVIFITNDEVTIRNALQLIKNYSLRGIIHAQNGILKFADQLAAEKIPVIWAGTTVIPNRWEPFDLNYNTASILASKGVLFAFGLGGWGLPSRHLRNLPVPASLSVAHGLSEEEALKSITINPAKILGIENLVGSLEEGKIANVVIWSGSPIQMNSRVLKVIINGRIIPLASIQTRLRDKFDKIVRERMNKKKRRFPI